jgi:hypothetical protein
VVPMSAVRGNKDYPGRASPRCSGNPNNQQQRQGNDRQLARKGANAAQIKLLTPFAVPSPSPSTVLTRLHYTLQEHASIALT